jgi:hypothetical protein
MQLPQFARVNASTLRAACCCSNRPDLECMAFDQQPIPLDKDLAGT